jgi:hypothetical protein
MMWQVLAAFACVLRLSHLLKNIQYNHDIIILVNNDINTSNLPSYGFEVQSTMGVSSPQSYTYTTIPAYIKSQIGYIYQRTFNPFSATNLTQNTYNQIATSITSSDINTGTYMNDVRLNVSA